MSDVVFAREGFTAFLDALTEDLVLWVRLYVNDPPISIDSVRDDFVEATYLGYDPNQIPRWAPGALRGGVAIAVPDVIQFVVSEPPWPTGIRGYFATHGRNGPLALAWRRPGEAFSFGPDNRVLTIFIKLAFPFAEQ